MLSLSRRFADLRIRYKMLISYSAVFVLSFSIGSGIIYFFVKEAIETNIESELTTTTQTILNMVRTSAGVSIKNHLRAVAEKNREIAQHFYQQAQAGYFSMEEAKSRTRDVMLSQTIGKTGYIYCIDSHGVILIHPENALVHVDLSDYSFIADQKIRKVGYLEYNWKNPGETHPRPKALYMTYFEPWDWIISVSSYRNEFRELVNVGDFRNSILSIVFGQTGYSYVLDLEGNLIVHPSLEGNYFEATDVKGRQFIREICERKSGKIIYSWAPPDELDAREKLVIFNYIPEYEWIVASSSYLEEFYAPLKTIGHLILATVVISFILVLPITLRISASITNPLQELMNRFASGARGDISVRMQRQSRDEVGALANYFNAFMERLEVYSESLKTEISDRKKAEAAIRKSEAKYRELVENANSIILRMTPQGTITFFNEFAQRFFGYTELEILGKPVVGTIIPEETPDGIQMMVRQSSQRGGQSYANMLRNGNRVWIAWTSRTTHDRSGEIKEYLCIGTDITEARKMENMMVQTEKMMSVGGLAAGMAHEINNPLGGMLQSLQNVIRRMSTGLPANEADAVACGTRLETIRCYLEKREIFRFLENIRVSGERASHIVENMLSFSRRSESRKTPVNLSELLDKAVELAAHDYDLKKKFDFRHIRVVRQYEPDMVPVPCAATEIEQVILNLLRNAAQAMGENGRQRQPPCITLSLRRESDSAVIEIADNGPGMDAQRLKRIFEPFFTTKEVGVGTGLGLSVSYFIITNNHNGSMSADASPGKGATFIIRLPLSDSSMGYPHPSGDSTATDPTEFIHVS
ncbi:cache domain-containing protein [uncultured Desulfosarcina sp.]|uniref:cache domain-containing protein n=1 Tax=uncultured Desulfosarcina sp. TaxID=218289 RepID=UPI0029C73A31|nr:cache domain-containing protein [uncultured Desulfosarcina sp.]